MADNSDAITLGVYNWMSANKKAVLDMVEAAVASAMQVAVSSAVEKAVDTVAAGVMIKVSHFLNENRAELNTAIAAAIATNWEARKK